MDRHPCWRTAQKRAVAPGRIWAGRLGELQLRWNAASGGSAWGRRSQSAAGHPRHLSGFRDRQGLMLGATSRQGLAVHPPTLLWPRACNPTLAELDA